MSLIAPHGGNLVDRILKPDAAAQFGLTPIQSQAILDMQLQRLTGLEREKILAELADLLKLIERLMAILGSDLPRMISSDAA